MASCVALQTTPARAAEPEPVRFSYEAPPGCPREDEFLLTVALDGGLVLRSDAAPARSFTITFAQGASVVGRLVVRGTDGREAVRTIDGARCEDVARSLAVLMALALEPRPANPPPLPPSRPLVEPPPTLPDHPPVEVVPPIERWRVGLSAAGTFGSGVGPGVLAGLAFYAEVAHDAPGPFAPSLRLGFEITATSTSNVSTPEVTFSRRVGRLDACPFRFTTRSDWTRDVFSADVCARLDVGMLDVGSTHAQNQMAPSYAWVAPGGLLRVRRVFPPFFLDLEGGAVVPLARERFYFEPNAQVFVIPPVAGVGAIGVGGYFL
jgi:hypothetical protein